MRQRTKELAARLAPRTTLEGPPPPAPDPPPAPAETAGTAATDTPAAADASPAAATPAPGVVAEPTRPAPRPRPRRPAAETPAPAGDQTATVNVTIVLTAEAAGLLRQARSDTSTREAIVEAVRGEAEELRRRHPPNVDPSGVIPRVELKRRRRMEAGWANKVPVRLYRVEKDAIDALADELGLTVSALVTEAIELHYRPATTTS